MIDGDVLHFAVRSVPEIAEFAATAFGDGKVERILMP